MPRPENRTAGQGFAEMQEEMLQEQQAETNPPPGEVVFSRAAYDVFLKLDPDTRRLVGLAPRSAATREIAPGIFSADAGPGLRVVFVREADAASVLALTGWRAA